MGSRMGSWSHINVMVNITSSVRFNINLIYPSGDCRKIPRDFAMWIQISTNGSSYRRFPPTTDILSTRILRVYFIRGSYQEGLTRCSGDLGLFRCSYPFSSEKTFRFGYL